MLLEGKLDLHVVKNLPNRLGSENLLPNRCSSSTALWTHRLMAMPVGTTEALGVHVRPTCRTLPTGQSASSTEEKPDSGLYKKNTAVNFKHTSFCRLNRKVSLIYTLAVL